MGSKWGSYDADSTALVMLKDGKKYNVDGIDSAAAMQKVQKDFAANTIVETNVVDDDIAMLLASIETLVDIEIEQPDGTFESQTAVKLLRVPVGFFAGKTVGVHSLKSGLNFDGCYVCSESQIMLSTAEPSEQGTEDGAPIRIARPTKENGISFDVSACDIRRPPD